MLTDKNILIVGGAGYIGSHMVDFFVKKGIMPFVLDNLSTGHREAVRSAKLIIGDMADSKLLDEIFERYAIDAVFHFASFIQVGESVANPLKYYQNNVAATINLLNAMMKWQVNYFIFSSSAAVYGEPRYTPIDEKHPLNPINPYGQSKKIIEDILQDLSRANPNFHFAALRYFNAAGADPSGKLTERHEPETHLIPLILEAIRNDSSVTVFGRDYATPDGTCIRDYVHVSDLCSAHALALEALLKGKKSGVYNLGTGKGHSVQEVIDQAEVITGKKIKINEGSRRAGDPGILVADATLARQELAWQPKYSDLKNIIEHAWKAIGWSILIE